MLYGESELGHGPESEAFGETASTMLNFDG